MKKLQGFLFLALLGFSVFILIFTPYEILRTIEARNWQPVDVIVTSHKIKERRGRYYAEIEIREFASGKTSRSVRVRFGDMVRSTQIFGILLKSDLYLDREMYPPGMRLTAYRSANGSEYVLAQNSIHTMLVLFICACIYPAVIIVSIVRSNKRMQPDAAKPRR